LVEDSLFYNNDAVLLMFIVKANVRYCARIVRY